MNTELKAIKAQCSEPSLDFMEGIAWARQNLDPSSAWFLAEAPDGVFFDRLGRLPASKASSFSSLRIFAQNGEIRQEKSPATSWTRVILEDETGAIYYCRETAYLIRDKIGDKQAQLIYREYFQPDASGFLLKQCDRAAGVIQE